MLPAFLTTVFFSLSAITGDRCARIFGGLEANFYRLSFAFIFLSIYVHLFGQEIGGSASSLFILSGLIGVGIGDMLFFQALPRIGARLTVLLIQCLTVPFAAAIEWAWLGTVLPFSKFLWITLILLGL
ncbi:MAG: EamA family transporter, partial [Limisphaerales bacterium]